MLRETLERLARLERTPHPFISAYVDLSPELEGSHQSSGGRPEPKPPLKSWRRSDQAEPGQYRPGITRLRDLAAERVRFSKTDGPGRESLDADIDRILSFLERDIDPAAKGAAVFACYAEGVWEVIELPVPVETRLIVDHMAVIHPLAYVLDTYDRYALCLADSQSARVYVVALGKAGSGETIDGPTINYKMTGGWSQKRIQERITNAVSDHIRNVAQRLEEIVVREEIPWIVLAGDEIVQTEFSRYLSDRIKDRVVDAGRLDTRLPAHEAVALSLEAVLQAEREQGDDIARQALDAALSEGLGTAGPEAVAHALRQGAVETLILSPDFRGDGWRCVEDPSILGDGGVPTICPAGPGEAEGVELREAFVTRAIQTGAQVEFVENSGDLGRMAGVAAILRWRPADLPPPADLAQVG